MGEFFGLSDLSDIHCFTELCRDVISAEWAIALELGFYSFGCDVRCRSRFWLKLIGRGREWIRVRRSKSRTDRPMHLMYYLSDSISNANFISIIVIDVL